jgi:hypothetical protein
VLEPVAALPLWDCYGGIALASRPTGAERGDAAAVGERRLRACSAPSWRGRCAPSSCAALPASRALALESQGG